MGYTSWLTRERVRANSLAIVLAVAVDFVLLKQVIILGPPRSALALSPRRRLHFLRNRGSRSGVSGLRRNRPPNNNNAPARYFLLFYSGPVPLLAAESPLPHQTGAPARYFLPFYSGSALSPRLPQAAPLQQRRCRSILPRVLPRTGALVSPIASGGLP